MSEISIPDDSTEQQSDVKQDNFDLYTLLENVEREEIEKDEEEEEEK